MTVKKYILILASLCSFSLATPPTNTSSVDIYQTPNTSSKSIDQYDRNTPFEVSMSDWLYLTKVKTNESGWVQKKQLEQLNGQKLSNKITFNGFNRSKKSSLSVHSPKGDLKSIPLYNQPDIKSKVKGKLLHNEMIDVSFGDWIYVTHLETKKSGWANRGQLAKLTGFKFDYTYRLSPSSIVGKSIGTIHFKQPTLKISPEEEIIKELKSATEKIKSAMNKTRDLLRHMNHAMKEIDL